MYKDITSDQLRRLQMLFPTGLVIVIKTREDHYALYQYVPDKDNNLKLIAEHLEKQFASNKAEIVA